MEYEMPSPRADAVTLRTYQRPVDADGSAFETWQDVVDRAQYRHQKTLWEMADRTKPDEAELQELRALGLRRRSTVAGRTLWLGGTPYAYDRPCCQFNCAYSEAATVYDLVDISWLLLNGCGVGFKPQTGTLHGYVRPIPKLTVLRSKKGPDHKGPQDNKETYKDGVWTIRLGDSAQAWAKAVGKLFGQRKPVQELVLDGSGCRGPGGRLKGYGWICTGVDPLLSAMSAMHSVLNNKAGDLLDELDIMDVVNHIGTVLSSRRSAQICLMDATNPRAREFSEAKKDYWANGNGQRRQSNNGFLFWSKPTLARLRELLHDADRCGGDPSIVNAEAARRKAPWFQGLNPCGEVLLGRFCNLVTNCLPLFRKDYAALERAMYLIARANYRQTNVNLNDGILQPAWHQTNESLRLCGVSATGIVKADWLTDYQIRRLRNAAVTGAYSQADEWGMPRPKAVTTLKPEGTGSKAMGTLEVGEIPEGLHRPPGRWVWNWVNFSQHDPLVRLHEAAGYKVLPNPSDPNNMLVCFPVDYSGVQFQGGSDGKEVNLEPAVSQFQRYMRWNTLWADHNCSCTISYSEDEIDALAESIHRAWDEGFIAVSVLRRADPTKTAKDLGHPYLPQEVVTRQAFEEYRARLRPVDYANLTGGIYEIDVEDCPGGVCPVK